MRKYGKLLLVLAVLAAVPAVASADTLLSGLRKQASAATAGQKQQNQVQAEQVKAAMHKAQIKGTDIKIEVVDGVARLTGKVTVPGHRARAGKACEQVAGIKRVDNKLRYIPAGDVQPVSATLMERAAQAAGYRPTAAEAPQRQASPIQQTAATVPNNQQVAERIGSALYQAGLQGYDISIHYQKGVATLSGPVGTPAQSAAAEAATKRVPGIQQVVNRLKVSQPVPQQQLGAQQQAVQQSPVQQGPPMSRAAYSQQLAPTAYAQQVPPVPPAAAGPMNFAPPAAGPHGPMMQASASGPMAMGGAGHLSHPHLPAHAWPAYAQYPNSAAVSYPTQYSASAFPYIGPFYPYPQVPMGWRDVRLQWDDGFWHVNFNKEPNVWKTLFSLHGDD